jgi:hypothetical protein
MITEQKAREFASHWIDSWNAHDLEEIISHYADDVEYFSVFLLKLSNNPTGMLQGKGNVKEYFAKGLAAYPDLRFVLLDVFWGVRSVVLRYQSVNNLIAAEVFEIDSKGLVSRVQCHYDKS